MDEACDVVVIGGGAVGLCSAWYLARDGRRVTVLDAGSSGSASDGNAGMIVPSHIVPLAAPGIVQKGLRWLVDPQSPFYIKLRPDLDLLHWLLRFRSHCTAAHVNRSIPVLRDLSLAGASLWEEITAADRDGSTYTRTGLLMLYRTEKGRKENLEEADLAEAAGLDVVRLDAPGVRELDAGILASFTGGMLYPQDGHLDPEATMTALAGHLEKAGVAIRRGVEVRGFQREPGRIARLDTSAGSVGAREVVLAAGAWSARLARMLGLGLPVQPAKGYSVTLDAVGNEPRIPHILTEDKLTVTPMRGRIRFGGTLALSGFDGMVDASRTEPLLRLLRTYRPAFTNAAASELKVWFGYRPCSPDGLPLVGRMPPYDNLTVATGHGMMGITLAPITGKLVAETVHGAPPSLDMRPLRPDRFRSLRLRFPSG